MERTKLFSDLISRNHLKTFDSYEIKKKVQPKEQIDQNKKEMCAVQKMLDIAIVRDYDPHDVFRYDVERDTFLFDSCGLMKNPSNVNW